MSTGKFGDEMYYVSEFARIDWLLKSLLKKAVRRSDRRISSVF
jgi:hypothetical protein